jgi:hypothetical protein
MPRESKKPVRRWATDALKACTRRPAFGENVAKRAIASVLAIGIVLGITGRGQDHESVAAVMTSQQPPAQSSPPGGIPATSDSESETASVRAATAQRLKALGAATDSGPASAGVTTASDSARIANEPAAAKAESAARSAPVSVISNELLPQKPLQKLLQIRLHLLDEHSELTLALKKANNPELSPEHQAEQLKAELTQIQAMLKQADTNPETLLPSSFHKTAGTPPTALASAMKDAIDATTHELGDWKSKMETLRSGRADRESKKKTLAADRDKAFKLVTSLSASSVEYEKAITDAQSVEDGRLAQERLVNYQWEVRVESLRLQVIESQISLEAKLAGIRELEAQVGHVQIQLAERALAQMRTHFRAESDKQESDLTRAAANEKNKAQSSDDPLERFRARRTAELLELEAQVLKNEQALATNPSPSFDEQQSLADHADKDFAQIRALLDDGQVSRLDAIRLNNEFRRIAPERERLVRNEMAVVEAHLQFFEDALTTVEIELFQDSLHDRLEHELLKERVSPERWAAGESLLLELERKHREILVRRQKALEKLAHRSSETLQQIARRLKTLDQEYSFIRTQIFWVRDQDPIAAATLWQGAREFNSLLKALLRLAQETMTPSLWKQPSAEFTVTALTVLLLPVALVKLRRALGGLIRHDIGEVTG